MFWCERAGCERVTRPREVMTRVVSSTRERNYPERYGAHRDGNDDPGGHGTEIAKEVRLCEACAGIDRDKGRPITEGEALAAIRERERLAAEARVLAAKASQKRRPKGPLEEIVEVVTALVALGKEGDRDGTIRKKGRRREA